MKVKMVKKILCHNNNIYKFLAFYYCFLSQEKLIKSDIIDKLPRKISKY